MSRCSSCTSDTPRCVNRLKVEEGAANIYINTYSYAINHIYTSDPMNTSKQPINIIYMNITILQDPPVSRNLPPVAGNITWSRHLLKRIEEPMRKFESNQSVLSSKDAKVNRFLFCTVLIHCEKCFVVCVCNCMNRRSTRRSLYCILYTVHPPNTLSYTLLHPPPAPSSYTLLPSPYHTNSGSLRRTTR